MFDLLGCGREGALDTKPLILCGGNEHHMQHLLSITEVGVDTIGASARVRELP